MLHGREVWQHLHLCISLFYAAIDFIIIILLLRRIKREAKRKRKAEKEGGGDGMPDIDPSAYGYAADNDPDNPANYHAPDEQSPFGALARGDQVTHGLKIFITLT